MAAKLVLITGASSGIGEALAKRYGRAGAHVLLLARNAERLAAVADAIKRDGGTATAYVIDLADPDAIEETGATIARQVGTPEILINNAGAGLWLPLIRTTATEARTMIEVPYLAAFNLTRAFLPLMLSRRSGAVACITSPASYLAWPNAAAYIAARRALAGFTGVERRKRTVVKPATLRAVFLLNAIAPGLVTQQLRRSLPNDEADSHRLSRPERFNSQ